MVRRIVVGRFTKDTKEKPKVTKTYGTAFKWGTAEQLAHYSLHSVGQEL